jgi:hypothetical protein
MSVCLCSSQAKQQLMRRRATKQLKTDSCSLPSPEEEEEEEEGEGEEEEEEGEEEEEEEEEEGKEDLQHTSRGTGHCGGEGEGERDSPNSYMGGNSPIVASTRFLTGQATN